MYCLPPGEMSNSYYYSYSMQVSSHFLTRFFNRLISVFCLTRKASLRSQGEPDQDRQQQQRVADRQHKTDNTSYASKLNRNAKAE